MHSKKRKRLLHCHINDCATNEISNISDIPIFGLPLDINLRDKWVRILRMHIRRFISLNFGFRICYLHFDQNDIEPEFGDERKNVFTLKPNAIPKYFDQNNDPLEQRKIDVHKKIGEIQTEEKIDLIDIPKKSKINTICNQCIQIDIEKQKIRLRIKDLESRLREKTFDAQFYEKQVNYLKSFAPNVEKLAKPTKCVICKMKLSLNEVHLHLCIDGTQISCQYCSKSFKATIELLDHLNIFHDDKSFYECNKCYKTFEMVKLLDIHTKTHFNDETGYSCVNCGVSFHTQSRLDIHIKLEHSELKHKLHHCGICGKVFKREQTLQNHIKEHNTANTIDNSEKGYMFECYMCKEQMQSLCEVRMHLTSHDEKINRQCLICKTRLTITQLNTHICSSQEINVDELSCEYCEKNCSSMASLLQHLDEHDDAKMYKCVECNRYFPLKLIRDFHQATHKKSDKSHICVICSKSFSQLHYLKYHIRRKHEDIERTKLCDECGKSFKMEIDLERHKKNIHSEALIRCPDCPLRFRNNISYRRHREHHSKRKYICNICNAELGTRDTLKSHMRMHVRCEKDKKYSCIQCPRKFFDKYHLKIHLSSVHTTLRQFGCSYCNASYKHKGDLTKHLRTHLGDDLYHCPDCPKRFRLPLDLKKHSYEHYKSMQDKAANQLGN